MDMDWGIARSHAIYNMVRTAVSHGRLNRSQGYFSFSLMTSYSQHHALSCSLLQHLSLCNFIRLDPAPATERENAAFPGLRVAMVGQLPLFVTHKLMFITHCVYVASAYLGVGI
jgi:hypothetical protein